MTVTFYLFIIFFLQLTLVSILHKKSLHFVLCAVRLITALPLRHATAVQSVHCMQKTSLLVRLFHQVLFHLHSNCQASITTFNTGVPLGLFLKKLHQAQKAKEAALAGMWLLI